MQHKNNYLLTIICTLTFGVLMLAVALQWYLKSLHQQALEESLYTVLKTTQQALRSWADKEKRTVEIWAQDPRLLQLTTSLLHQQLDPAMVENSDARLQHKYMPALFYAHFSRGFSIINRQHHVIASSHNDLIGKNSLLFIDPKDIERVWRGETIITQPRANSLPTILINTPIRNADNEIIATLCLRVNPRKQFIPILNRGRTGDSGETYAFNRSGLLLNNSRFNKQLHQTGLLKPQQNEILNPSVRRPDVDLIKSATTVQGVSGSNTQGYKDYRGVNVVGAWLWDDNVNLGLETKLDYSEAYLAYTQSRNLAFITAILTGAVLGVLVWLRLCNQHKLQQVSYQLESVLNNSAPLIYIKDRQDRLLLVNQTLSEALGQCKDELLGESLPQQLISDNQTSDSQSNDSDQMVLKKKQPIEYEQILSLHDTPQIYRTVKFPVCDKNDRAYAIGVVATNITSYRHTETTLEERERFLGSMMANLPGMVYRRCNDESHTMVYLSQGGMALTAYPPKKFIDEKVNYLSLIHKDDRRLVIKSIKTCLHQHRSFEVEYRIRDANGVEKWVCERGRGIYDYNDNVAFIEGFITDISDRKQIDKELTSHRKHLAGLIKERTQKLDYERIRLNALINNAADGIININSKGTIMLFSPTAENIFGYNATEVIGKNVTLLIPDDKKHAHKMGIAQRVLLQTPLTNKTLELQALHKNGHTLPIELSLSQTTVDQEIIFTGIIRDITERLKYQKALETATVMAEEANQTKSEFLANMSHEIRTPMNAIIGMTQLALKTDLSGKQKRLLTAVNTASNNLMGIINDILDFSKIEAGKLDIENIPFSLDKTINTMADIAAVRAQKKGLEFIFDIGPDVPLYLIGDPLRLNQIFTNLCYNAVKFTEVGEIIVRIHRISGDNKKVSLIFSVIDTGIGISQANQQHLFQAFNQTDATITRNYGGTGLGLSICKKLVTLMDGNISVDSEEGKGSTFSFILSFDIDPKATKATINSQDLQASILIAEDHLTSQKILLTQLNRIGFDTKAVDAEKALLQQLQPDRQPIDILLLNWRLGHTDGCHLLEQIKSNSKIQQPSIIMMTTNYNREELSDTAVKLGAKGILTKPFNNTELFSQLKAVLSTEKQPIENTQDDSRSASHKIDSQVKNRILIVEDNEINQLVAHEILIDLGYEVDIANNGQEAINKVTQLAFDAVLMDVQMPIMDGYEATRTIRKLPQGEGLPIIAITANAMPSDKDKCLASGMNGFLDKPINIEKLTSTLAYWLQLDTNTSQPRMDVSLPRQAPGLNIELGLINCSYNQAFYLKLMTKFTNDYNPRLSHVRDLINNNKYQDAEHIVHAIKGVSGNLGATTLYASVITLESALKNQETAVLIEYFEQVDTAMQALINTVAQLILPLNSNEK